MLTPLFKLIFTEKFPFESIFILDNIEKNKDMVVINKENKKNLKHPLFNYSIEGLILIPLI